MFLSQIGLVGVKSSLNFKLKLKWLADPWYSISSDVLSAGEWAAIQEYTSFSYNLAYPVILGYNYLENLTTILSLVNSPPNNSISD